VAAFGLRTVAVLGALLLVLTFLFFRAQPHATDRQAQVVERLHRLRELDATLNQDVLRARFNLLNNYDNFVDLLKVEAGLLEELKLGPFAVYRLGEAEVDRALEAYSRLHEERRATLERFKSRNAILKNSLAYFPVLAAEIATRLHAGGDHPRLAAQLDKLLNDMLRSYASNTPEIASALRSQLASLRGAARVDDPRLRPDLGAVVAHGVVLMDYRDEVNRLTNDIISMPAESLGHNLYQAFERWYQRTEAAARTYGYVLYILSVVLLAYLAYALVRLRQSALARDQLNKSLVERTAEVQATNMVLQTKIKEREQAEMEARRSMEAAEAGNRAKSEFLANMSHELRTPLNAILGFSELIRDEILGPVGTARYRSYAKDINDSAEHLLRIINDVLDLSKVEAGKLELEEADIDVTWVIGRCLALVAEQAERDGLALESNLPDDLPRLRADPRKMRQILLNLLSNAVKFTPAGGKVTVTAAADPERGLSIAVSDTGIGIAPGNVETAMAPFEQVDASINRKYQGTGLGLPLTKALVELHGGVLTIESEVGVGTTATTRFPPSRMVTRHSPLAQAG